MRRCVIISGGDYCPMPTEIGGAFLIACDKGYEYALRYGVTPDLLLGDFDSAALPQTKIPVERFPSEKDDTDTMLAAKYALDHGYDEITILCAFGGRLDHTLGNLQTAEWIARRGGAAALYGEDTVVTVFPQGARTFPRRDGWSLSLLSVTDCCEAVTIRGAKYETNRVRLPRDSTIGISNTWKEDKVSVSFTNGIIMVVESKLRANEHI